MDGWVVGEVVESRVVGVIIVFVGEVGVFVAYAKTKLTRKSTPATCPVDIGVEVVADAAVFVAAKFVGNGIFAGAGIEVDTVVDAMAFIVVVSQSKREFSIFAVGSVVVALML